MMKEIIYRFHSRGTYEASDSTSFADETHYKLVAEPHDFSLAIGGEVLRKTSFEGCEVTVSREGGVVFCTLGGKELGRADACGQAFAQVRLEWKPGTVTVLFGSVETVDYYPNCDGEHDRWGTEWVTRRSVTLDWEKGSVKVD